jgi:hypothetical protein
LPEDPTVFVFHPLQKELPEGINGRYLGKAIINVLVILFRFEPEFVAIREE